MATRPLSHHHKFGDASNNGQIPLPSVYGF